MNILIADDQTLFRDMMLTLLDKETDISLVGCVGNGLDVLAFCAARSVDLVLMDIRMPEMDGIAAARKLQSVSPSTRVILLTAFVERDMTGLIGLSNIYGVLLKDIHARYLLNAIRMCADGLFVMNRNLLSIRETNRSGLDSSRFSNSSFRVGNNESRTDNGSFHGGNASTHTDNGSFRGGNASTHTDNSSFPVGSTISHMDDNSSQLVGSIAPGMEAADAEQTINSTFSSLDLQILQCLTAGMSNREIAESINYSEGTVKSRISHLLAEIGLKDRTQLALFALRNRLT